MPYLYETHLHTVQASACGRSKGSDYISFYKEKGYTGIIVTDHFLNGNTCVPSNLPWEKRINLFCQGYEDAKKEGDKQGLQVFFAWECRFGPDEFLVYGLDKEWLLAHPEVLEWNHITHYQEIKKAGGLVVQAHPFRERDYLDKIELHPFQCDAWEVANAGNPAYQDRLAYRYAKSHNIPMTAGSDIHKIGETVTSTIYGLAFDEPLTSIQDYVTRIKTGKGYQLQIPENLLTLTPDRPTDLPVYLFNENNQEAFIKDFESIL